MTTKEFMESQGFRLATEFNTHHYVKDLDPFGNGKTEYLNHVSTRQANQLHQLYLEGQIEALRSLPTTGVIDQCKIALLKWRDDQLAALTAQLEAVKKEGQV